jgi:NADPH:quinone reductase-like Zn-dependent oxidoreductase
VNLASQPRRNALREKQMSAQTPPPNPANPASLVRYDTLIRLTQLVVLSPATFQPAEFEAAWKAAAESPRPGVIYRELCRQIPEWSALAAAEIDNPINAAYVEYLIAEPQTDLEAIPALPASTESQFAITQDLHTVAFRFAKDPEHRSDVVMFNLFEVDGPPGMEQGFLMDWPPRGEFKSNEAATLSTMLHQRILEKASIKAFNRAEVVSAEAYAEGIARFEEAFPRRGRKAAATTESSAEAPQRPPIRSHLGLFQIAASATGSPSVSRDTMRAVAVDAYGPPEVLQLRSIPKPEPGPGQARIRVCGSSVNPLDVKMRSGDVRHIYPSWFPDVLGYSFAGIVDAIGTGVDHLLLGQEVYGINNPIMRHGYADYVVAPAKFFYPKPARMDWATAAAAPSIFATAHGGLFGRANLQADQTVLIHGGSGVIGSCAVQLAKQAGAHVIATASSKNVDRVRELGADVVVDYKTQRFEDYAQNVDLVFDTVGGETRDRSWPLVRKGGTLASLLPPPPEQELAARYGIQAFMVHGHPNIVEIMPEMTRRLEVGQLAFPEVAAAYPLERAAEAHAAFEASAPRGRIVLVVE